MELNGNIIELSTSEKGYNSKEDIKYDGIRFKHAKVTNKQLINIILNGHSIAPIMKDYTKSLTMANIKCSYIVGVDIDETKYRFEEFIKIITNKPTIAYTTFSSTEESQRFRLLYVLDKPIQSTENFKRIYQQIADGIEHDTHEEIKDNCGQCFNRLFNGTYPNAKVYQTNKIYQLAEYEDINPIIKELRKKVREKKRGSKKEITHIPNDLLDLIDKTKDYNELLLILTRDRHNQIITESKVTFNNEGYAELTKDYFEIKRVFEGNRPKVYKDGELRHKHLFQWLLMRKLIKPIITFEELLTNAIFDVIHFIDNEDGKFNKSLLIEITKSAFNHDVTIKVNENTKSFKVNKQWCVNNGITPNQYKMLVRKKMNYNSIGEWYDTSKSVKENLTYAKDNNIKVSRATLFRFCKDNGIKTKLETKKIKPIIKNENAQVNVIDLTPIEIEQHIKTNYPTLEEFEDNFKEIADKYKSILSNDKPTPHYNRWVTLLMYYQELKQIA